MQNYVFQMYLANVDINLGTYFDVIQVMWKSLQLLFIIISAISRWTTGKLTQPNLFPVLPRGFMI
jgi:hypothetical protein